MALVGRSFHVVANVFASFDFSQHVLKIVGYPGAVIGLVDQQPKQTTIKKLQLKLYLPSMETYPIDWPQFYTTTILEWKPLLKPVKYKDIIIQSLQHLTATKKITLFAFVIMDNNLRMIWQATRDKTPKQLQHSF